MVGKVICDKAETCSTRPDDYCDAKVPHYECPECGNCSFDPTAKCIPVVESTATDMISKD